jgi:uncharacterized membrane protein (UPF0136 family)
LFSTRVLLAQNILLCEGILMAPTGSSHVNVSMAALCAGGGLYGYFKAGSMPSVSNGINGCYVFIAASAAAAAAAAVLLSIHYLKIHCLLTAAGGWRFVWCCFCSWSILNQCKNSYTVVSRPLVLL